jgi:hypothetical protein
VVKMTMPTIARAIPGPTIQRGPTLVDSRVLPNVAAMISAAVMGMNASPVFTAL